jgi:DNA-binding MarR family transcriptional regulator
MDIKASYEEGHLAVAAIRVLLQQHEGRPPTEDEIADLLKISREWVGVLVRGLEKAGVVRTLTGPFETRVEIQDHRKLEDLPHEDSTAGVDEELKEFSERKRKEEEKLQKLFGGDILKKQDEKMNEIADQLKGFKPKPPKSAPFFKESPEEDQ